jgi:Mg2+ and Co2+ transporter CorA
LIESLIKEDLADVLKKWDKPLFKEHLATIKRFVEVRRDREYYGTSPRRKDRIHEFIDLELYQNDVIYGFKRFVTLNERGDGINYNIEFTSKSQAEKHMKMVNNIQFVLDQLVELVYREGFLDVIIDFRDLRNEIEEFMLIDHSATEETLSKMIELSDEIFLKVKSLEDRFSELPLPTRIYKRVEELVTVKEPQLVRRWDKYSKILRSTKS